MEAQTAKLSGPVIRFPYIDHTRRAPPQHSGEEYLRIAKARSLGVKTGIFRVIHQPIVVGESAKHIIVVEAWGERMSVGLTISWQNNNLWPKALVHCELAQVGGYVRFMARGVDPFTGMEGALYVWCPRIWAVTGVPGILPVFPTSPSGFVEEEQEEMTTPTESTSASGSPTLAVPPPCMLSAARLLYMERKPMSYPVQLSGLLAWATSSVGEVG